MSAADAKTAREDRASFLDRLTWMSDEQREITDYAYDLAKESCRPHYRDGGQRSFEHPRGVALILLEEDIQDPDLLWACLLHDTVEDSPIFGSKHLRHSMLWEKARWRIARVTSPETARIVLALTKPHIEGMEILTKDDATKRYMSNLVSGGPRVILVKLCDRLHNVRTLLDADPKKRVKNYHETREVYLQLFSIAAQEFPVPTRRLLNRLNTALVIVKDALRKDGLLE